MKKEMLINVLQPEETRVAILEDEVLEELYVERISAENFVGNIYKGRIVNVEPSIQAAFVDFGVGRNGFLHISDVAPQYFKRPGNLEDVLEPLDDEMPPSRGGRPRMGRSDTPRSERTRRERGPEETKAAGDSRSGRGRRRRRRGGGRGREEFEPAGAPAPPPESLPELEDLLFDDVHEPAIEPEPFESRDEDISERSRRTESRPAPEPEPEPEGDFGAGILDDSDEEPPPAQRGVYRRTDPPNEDADSFADGLFEEHHADDVEAPFDDEPQDDDLAETEPEPRTERFDDDVALDPWSELDAVEAEAKAEREAENENDAARSEDRGDRQRRPERRRRRGRRGQPHESERPQPRARDPRGQDTPVEENELEWPDAAVSEDEFDETPQSRERPRRRGERFGGNGFRRPRQRPLIQDIFKKGQEVLVEVIKEGIGNKGPTLSTYMSIPGRFLVLMPGMGRVGVSRKIQNEEHRRKLRQMVLELNRPKGIGVIIRTAGVERTQQDLERDLNYLVRLWEVVRRRIRNQKAPAVVYQESDMIIRTIRDVFASDVDTIWIDEPTAFDRAKEFLQIVMPRQVARLKLYTDPEPLFHHFKIEQEITKIQQRTVPLPEGGSIVVDQTEALVAIDVNSGSFRTEANAEETAYQINLAAAKEIARQLRLRDLGGVIVNDFIDMREERHRRGVEHALREAVERDRARTKILRMSAFGIIEMTRQRIRPSLKRSLYRDCPVCNAMGHIKTVESVAIECMRLLTFLGQLDEVRGIRLISHPDIAEFLQNHKRKEIAQVEEAGRATITIVGKESASPQQFEIDCLDADGERISESKLPQAARR